MVCMPLVDVSDLSVYSGLVEKKQGLWVYFRCFILRVPTGLS